MSTNTTNYNLIKPGVNDPTDQDLWGGMLNTDLDMIDTLLKTISIAQWPVGSIFTATVSTNPATLLGFGTWVAFAAGRVLVGVGTGTDINAFDKTFGAGSTGGEYTHAMTEDENGPHTHTLDGYGQTAANLSPFPIIDDDRNNTLTTATTSSSGLGTPHNNVQPYITVYMWQRTV